MLPHPIDANNKKNVLTIPKAAFTLIALVWILLASYVPPRVYNYWAILATEIMLFGVWINGSMFAGGGRYPPNTGVCYPEDGYEYLCAIHASKSENAAAYCSYFIMGLATCPLVL
jgi:hypothetical protein